MRALTTLVLCVAAGCGGTKAPPAEAPSLPAESGPSDAADTLPVAPPAEAPPTGPAPTEAPAAEVPRPRLELEPHDREVVRGGTLVFTIRNAGTAAYRKARGDADAGCATLRWSVQVYSPHDVIFTRRTAEPRCQRAADPSADFVVEPGDVAGTATFDTSAAYDMDASHAQVGAPKLQHVNGSPLARGPYVLHLVGPGAQFEVSVQVR